MLRSLLISILFAGAALAQGGPAYHLGSGPSLPAKCSPKSGDVFVLITGATGMQYNCTAVNTWAPSSGTADVTVKANGTTVGSPRGILDYHSGFGILSVLSDTGTEISITQGVDTAVVGTLATAQSGSPLLCTSGSGSSTIYTCAMSPTLTAYSTGMVLHWTPGLSGAGGPTTLNVDTLGAKGVKQGDGVSDPGSGDIVAGSMREVWYDGVNFRFLEVGQVSGGGSEAVESVFGRTGPVIAMTGDYTAAQVTNVAATNASNTFTAGTQDFSGAAHTRPAIVVGTVGNLPATCAVGELAFVSGQTAGQQIYECSATNVWTQQVAGGGGGGGGSAPVFAAYASRGTCTSSNVGQMFFASEISSKKWICDGNAWQPVAFDMQVVEPTTLTWAAAGESTTPTITSVAGALVVSATASGRWQVAATPISLSTPYTIEVAFTYSSSLGANDGCGLALFSSTPPTISGPTWMAWFIGSTASQGEYLPQFRSVFYDEWADVMGDYQAQQVVPVIREKLVDDGTNRTFYLNNGAGYFQVFQQSDATNNTPHLPGYWGVGCGVGSGGGAQLVLYSASVHH